jgi:hypothetical protein
MKKHRGRPLTMSKSQLYAHKRSGWTSEGSDRAAIIIESQSRLLCRSHGMQTAIRLEADGCLKLACGCKRPEATFPPKSEEATCH